VGRGEGRKACAGRRCSAARLLPCGALLAAAASGLLHSSTSGGSYSSQPAVLTLTPVHLL
jgi:hypothetical protein